MVFTLRADLNHRVSKSLSSFADTLFHSGQEFIIHLRDVTKGGSIESFGY